MNNFFVFTEAYGCGRILKKCLESYFKYHDHKVNVFGTSKDFKELGKFKNVEYWELSDDNELRECFKHGHLGTAHLESRVIREFSNDYKYLIHFDSDLIFMKESISLLTDKLDEGYDLVGPRRCYKNNANGRGDLSNIEDVVQTYFHAFNKEKISQFDFNILRSMIVGFYNPIGHPTLDYFDPVSFDILKNGGKIFFLDPDLVGGLNEDGKRINKFSDLNSDMDFGDHLCHFAGIGSGMKFTRDGAGSVPQSYVDWAKSRYSLYMKLFYGEDTEYDIEKYEKLKSFFQ